MWNFIDEKWERVTTPCLSYCLNWIDKSCWKWCRNNKKIEANKAISDINEEDSIFKGTEEEYKKIVKDILEWLY